MGMVRGLGWLSAAMGLCLLAPARAARLFGLGPRPWLMRAIGARDLAIGLGLLLSARPAPWLYAHALADATDATLVAGWLLSGSIARGRGLAWLALALGYGWWATRQARRLDAVAQG